MTFASAQMRPPMPQMEIVPQEIIKREIGSFAGVNTSTFQTTISGLVEITEVGQPGDVFNINFLLAQSRAYYDEPLIAGIILYNKKPRQLLVDTMTPGTAFLATIGLENFATDLAPIQLGWEQGGHIGKMYLGSVESGMNWGATVDTALRAGTVRCFNAIVGKERSLYYHVLGLSDYTAAAGERFKMLAEFQKVGSQNAL